MKLTNHDGTLASVEAYAIWNNVLILREETLPWLKENPNNLEEDDRLERIKAIKGYERKLLLRYDYEGGRKEGDGNAGCTRDRLRGRRMKDGESTFQTLCGFAFES